MTETVSPTAGICGLPINQQHALQVGAVTLQRLGPRVIGEVLLDVVQRRPDLPQLLEALDRLGGWSEQVVEISGADRFPPLPLREVA